MTQHKLRLDDLQVESFQVLPAAPRERGTVQGHIVLTAYAGCSRTCIYKDTCAISCRTCYGQLTCNDSCLCDTTPQLTCGASCGGTCLTACGCSGDIFCPEGSAGCA